MIVELKAEICGSALDNSLKMEESLGGAISLATSSLLISRAIIAIILWRVIDIALQGKIKELHPWL